MQLNPIWLIVNKITNHPDKLDKRSVFLKR